MTSSPGEKECRVELVRGNGEFRTGPAGTIGGRKGKGLFPIVHPGKRL